MVLDFLAVDNFDFTRKNVKKILDEKLVKMLGLCQNWIFGQKFDFSNSVNMLDIESIVDAEGFVYRKIAIRKFATEMSSTFISEAILACGGSGFNKVFS